jgi:NAD(P)H-hydrate epimerase
MATPPIPSVPVLSAQEASGLEAGLLGGDERREWRAMQRAGRLLAEASLGDLGEAGGLPAAGRILVLAGKGNNAGDAMIAAREILARSPGAAADVVFAFGPRRLGPLAARSWRGLCEAGRSRVQSVGADALAPRYDLCLDGIFGLSYRAPLPGEAASVIEAAAALDIRLRAAVDLPSGLGEKGAFRADFTYATGSVKAALLGCANAGRPRFLDLGFFAGAGHEAKPGDRDRVVLRTVLEPLSRLRPAGSDKRSQGRLAIVGGSASYPGAVLMATLAALRSGVGLVTAFVPKQFAAAFAARAPEAMWVGLPETAAGGLSPEGVARIVDGLGRADALVIGPGMGREPETLALALEVVVASQVPMVVDADALQPDVARAGSAPRILTPHAGELARISGGADLRSLARELRGVVVAKGPVTRVTDGGSVHHVFFGGPVLARGGSGDLLSGIAGGLLAQGPDGPLLAACRAAVWHGAAADLLARARGQAAVHTVQLLDFLAPALRESAPCPAR